MARKVYVKKRFGRESAEHKGLFWIIAAIMLILLMVPILWTQYPFRSHKQIKVTTEEKGSSAAGKLLVMGKIPRLQAIAKPASVQEESPEKSKEMTTEKHPVTDEKPGAEGSISNERAQEQPAKPLNPYELAARAEKQREAHERESREAVAAEGLQDMNVLARVQSAETKNAQPEDTQDLYGMLKKNIASPTEENTKRMSPRETETSKVVDSRQKTSAPIEKKPNTTTLNPDYFIQVGAFSQKGNASEVRDRLEKMGYQVVIHKVHHTRLGDLYLVRVLFQGNYSEARKEQQKLQKIVGEKPIIVKPR